MIFRSIGKLTLVNNKVSGIQKFPEVIMAVITGFQNGQYNET